MSREIATMTKLARVPKQARSQRSFEQVLQASVEILIEDGYDGFTLQKVSKRSGVSTGSIYARIDSKDDLVHIIAAREIEDRVADHAQLMERASTVTTLAELIPVLFNGFAETQRIHAPLLRPLMLRSALDPLLAEAGRAAMKGIRDDIVGRILDFHDEITHPRPERAARFALIFADNSVFRFLGFGTLVTAPDMGGWDHLMEDIVDAVGRVLCGSGLTEYE